MPRLIEFFMVEEPYGTPGPHEMLDIACDAAEAGDPRWVDHLTDISNFITDSDEPPDAADQFNSRSNWRANVHQQLDQAISWGRHRLVGNEWEKYLDNIQNILRDRARRHEV